MWIVLTALRRPYTFVVLAIVIAIFGIKKLRFEGDVSKLNGITEPTRADDKLISQTWGDALGMTLVVGSMSTSAFAVSKHTARTASSTVGAGHVRMMDRDRNGKVSKSEFSQYMSQTFHRRDLNKNGQLERNELSPTLLRRMDRDRNGAVSKTEYMQPMSQTFQLAGSCRT